jgi:[ribosomal protein S18]-alanine N-acetyltransferase
MSARAQPQRQPPRLRVMRAVDLDRVLGVEQGAYSFPWTRGNFIDSLAAGYLAELLVDDEDTLIGYFVAMPGVDELHLLNLTVAPPWQGQGHASTLLDVLEQRCRDHHAPSLWLEVRAGNARARQVYARRGFAEVGLRRNYYPAGHGTREDAIVMRLPIPGAAR